MAVTSRGSIVAEDPECVLKKRLEASHAKDLDVVNRCQSRKTLNCPVVVVPYSASLDLKTKNRSGLIVS